MLFISLPVTSLLLKEAVALPAIFRPLITAAVVQCIIAMLKWSC